MSTSPPPSSPTTTGVSGKVATAKQRQSKGGIGAGAIVAIVILLMLICCIGAWCVYAYRHPTSKSGLFLIDVSFDLRCCVLVNCWKWRNCCGPNTLAKPELIVVELGGVACHFFFFQWREVGGFFLHKIARIGSSCVNVHCAAVCFEAHFVYEPYFIHSVYWTSVICHLMVFTLIVVKL